MRTFLVALLAAAAAMVASDDTPRGRAATLVSAWVDTVTKSADYPIEFDDEGWLGLGPFAVTHLGVQPEMEVCAFVASSELENRTPAEVQHFTTVAVALNDPAIGGMYERAGGSFRWDRGREAYLLCKRLHVDTPKDVFIREMDELLDVALEWQLVWFLEVARVAHGQLAAPSTPKKRSLLIP